MWAASGSEAIQKALWAALALDPARDLIIATRDGFHGKKGLAEAVTGSETDHEPRSARALHLLPEGGVPRPLAPQCAVRSAPYRAELDRIASEHRGIACLITEPYLGGGGSYHPPAAYLGCSRISAARTTSSSSSTKCRPTSAAPARCSPSRPTASSRTSSCSGKGLGNGVPVACAAGRAGRLRRARLRRRRPTPGAPTRSAAPRCWRRSTCSRATTSSAPRAGPRRSSKMDWSR